MDQQSDNFTPQDNPDNLQINNLEQPQIIQTPTPPVIPKQKHHLFLWLLITLVCIGIISGLIYGFRNSIKSMLASNNTTSHSLSGNYHFYNSPKRLGNLNFFNDTSIFGTNCGTSRIINYCPPEYSANQLLYFQIGLTPQNQPIIIVTNSKYDNSQFQVTLVSIETTPGHYTILSKLSPSFISTSTPPITSNISLT